MAGEFSQIVSALFFMTIIMRFPVKTMPETTISDQIPYYSPPSPAECPYPCLPPPSVLTNCPPPPPLPPATPLPPSGPGYYPPPSVYYPPPTGYLPYYPPPSYVNYYAPPPPDPILPYFPFLYRHPPPPPDLSSAPALRRSMAFILNLILLGLFLSYHSLAVFQ